MEQDQRTVERWGLVAYCVVDGKRVQVIAELVQGKTRKAAERWFRQLVDNYGLCADEIEVENLSGPVSPLRAEPIRSRKDPPLPRSAIV